MIGRLTGSAPRLRLPRRTVRLRLTLLYGVLFLISGAALLACTYLLVRQSTGDVVQVTSTRLEPRLGPAGSTDVPPPAQLPDQAAQLRAQADQQRAEQLHQLLVQSSVALGLMAVVSIGLGWLVAGRVLGPLRSMTAATKRISERNLDERLAVDGPSDELKDLGDTIDGLLARLETAFTAQRRFVANAAHELRTPLTMMRTSLDVATGKPGPLAPELTALDGKLREGLDRAGRLLEDLLTLARAQHGALPERTIVSMREVVSTAIQRHSDALAGQGIELHRELHPASLIGSPTLLSNMVENLIDNAIRHNEPSGWIRVETRVEGSSARLVVENGGQRLDETAVGELTQPFQRSRIERTNSEHGLGLGLSIVAAIVEAHGGDLRLEPRPDGGMRVRIRFSREPEGQLVGGPA